MLSALCRIKTCTQTSTHCLTEFNKVAFTCLRGIITPREGVLSLTYLQLNELLTSCFRASKARFTAFCAAFAHFLLRIHANPQWDREELERQPGVGLPTPLQYAPDRGNSAQRGRDVGNGWVWMSLGGPCSGFLHIHAIALGVRYGRVCCCSLA